MPAGDCVTNKRNAAGTCELTPEICTYNIDEVCGCDYVTYDNECVMNAAGVSKRRDGPCSRNGGEDDEDEAEEDDAEFIVVTA